MTFVFFKVKWDSSGIIFIRKFGLKKSVILSPVNPFTLYVINVSAFTSKGEGKHVTVEEQTDEGGEYGLQRQEPRRSLCHEGIKCIENHTNGSAFSYLILTRSSDILKVFIIAQAIGLCILEHLQNINDSRQ